MMVVGVAGPESSWDVVEPSPTSYRGAPPYAVLLVGRATGAIRLQSRSTCHLNFFNTLVPAPIACHVSWVVNPRQLHLTEGCPASAAEVYNPTRRSSAPAYASKCAASCFQGAPCSPRTCRTSASRSPVASPVALYQKCTIKIAYLWQRLCAMQASSLLHSGACCPTPALKPWTSGRSPSDQARRRDNHGERLPITRDRCCACRRARGAPVELGEEASHI